MKTRYITKGNPEYIRKLNKEMVLNCFYFNEPISRIAVSRLTKIDKSTMTNIVKEMLEEHTLNIYGSASANAKGGRCPELICINRDANYFIGVNLGRCTIIVTITDIYGTLVDMLENPECVRTLQVVENMITEILRKNTARVNGKLAGIGSAVVSDYHIVSNTRNCSSELGHVTVSEDGPICSCGKRGCLENYAGGRAIAEEAKKLGFVISHAINILDPDAVILEGGVSRTKAGFVERIRQTALKNSMGNRINSCDILLGDMGKYAEALGAAGLVISEQMGISYDGELKNSLILA